MKFQEYAHDKTLGNTLDTGTNRLAQDPAVIRDFVRDSTLTTQLRNRLTGIGEILKEEKKDVEATTRAD